MATKITITDDQRTEFLRAREAHTADEAKSIRRSTWASIRAQHGIPEDIKLRVEIDHQFDPDYKVLRDKETDYPLWKLDDGRVIASREEPSEAVVSPTPAAALSSGSRFASTAANPNDLYCITVDDLLVVLREGREVDNYVYTPNQLPAGLPDITVDGVVLDTQDRVIYFRA